MRGPSRFAAAALAALLLAGCREVDSKFPETGSFFGSIVTAQVNSNTSRTPAPGEYRFRIRAFQAEFNDREAHTFVGAERTPCDYSFTVFSLLDPVPATLLTRQCGGGGLVLEAGTTGCFSFMLDVEAITAVYAERPDLSTGRDYDGDGVPNESDNCPTQFNPRVPRDPLDPDAGTWQPDSNGDGTGDACRVEVEGSDGTVFDLPDQDLDGVTDGLDNCAWYPNASQADANENLIGDECERILPIVLDGGSRFLCPPPGDTSQPKFCKDLMVDGEPYEMSASQIVHYSVDFGEAVTCDGPITNCSFDPTRVVLRPRAGAMSDARPTVPCALLP